MIQECVFDAISIYAATQDVRAENANFRMGLERFLSSYMSMRQEEGFIPEIPSLRGENVLVGQDGRVWVVDTNNIIKTRTRDGIPTSRYLDRFKLDHVTQSDSIIREIESIVSGLEKGHIEGNPQG